MAEGSGLRPEEIVLITLHEELYHRGVLPKVPHCTAVSVGPPDFITITAGPTGAPNPVASEAEVAVSVTATDSIGHALSYYWLANCPSLSST